MSRSVFCRDLEGHSDASFIPEIDVQDLLARDLDDLIIERPCLEILRDSEVIDKIHIINGLEKGNLTKALKGEPVGTIIRRS
jgi:molybdenum storage protein